MSRYLTSLIAYAIIIVMKKYKKIKISQNDTNNWLEWRHGGIGASESAVLMGSLPFSWKDILDLWKFKVGLIENDFIENDAVKLGKQLEPEARDKYTEVTGIQVSPDCYERTDFPFIKASLDGINRKENHIVEIKCPGTTKFYEAKKGIVSPYYYSQIQQQAYCSGAVSCDYWVYRKKEGGILIKVPRNEEYIQELIRRASIFWDMVETKTPCLPRHLGINPFLESDPFMAGEHPVELVGTYKNTK